MSPSSTNYYFLKLRVEGVNVKHKVRKLAANAAVGTFCIEYKLFNILMEENEG